MDEKTGAKVITVAQSLVGSHYIHGAYGATPGLNDGCPCRPGSVGFIADEKHLDPKVKLDKTLSLAVNAATTTIQHQGKLPTYSVCAGNYDAPLAPKYPGNKFPSDTDPDLIAYLDSLKGKQPSTWPTKAQYFTPRRTFGPGQNGGDGNGLLVWAESCKDKKHFDCVGFIGYCYWKASGAIVQLEISDWRDPNKVGQVYLLKDGWKEDSKEKEEKYKATIGRKPADVMDGDILIKADHHIAFVGKNKIIYEAQDSQYGVCATPGFDLATSGNKWTHLVRVVTKDTPELEWPMGWWRVWDGGLWYYYLGPDNVATSSRKGPVYDTIKPPMEPRNKGTWFYTAPKTLVITWKKVPGAKEEAIETFWNAEKDSKQINATSTLYTPLVANWMK
ncbi:hypothetical protein [Bradyrhizobium sp. WSM1417]|uniref:hypothetical protein n=1 Tax=Bradyrhizobium sp. WSM1417 TaxID=754500 RepID=UPI0004849401|nr:hypothetical protein [Bradyrhizobium sp. WSM1417]